MRDRKDECIRAVAWLLCCCGSLKESEKPIMFCEMLICAACDLRNVRPPRGTAVLCRGVSYGVVRAYRHVAVPKI